MVDVSLDSGQAGLLTTAVVLAGGKGTRLRCVTGDRIAKPAVLVNGRPFVDYVLDQLEDAGVRGVILSVGHRADSVLRAMHDQGQSRVAWVPSFEDKPLGTAGALASMRDVLPDRFAVVNGDTFVSGLEYGNLLAFHRRKGAALTIGLVKVACASDYGTVLLDEQSKVIGFLEKGCSAEGLVNCGVYVLEKSVLNHVISGDAFSMERELIPLLLRKGVEVCGYAFEGCFYDIGTPERLRAFHRFAEESLRRESGKGQSPAPR